MKTDMNNTARPRIALGPILYYWQRSTIEDFYADLADAPVDTVYLGETVCSKRRALRLEEWLEIGGMLEAAGKQVVLSTLSLVEAGSELGAIRRICDNGRFRVEANDMTTVQILVDAGLPFATGPSVNVYNPRTLEVLARRGLTRWVPPVELSRDSIAELHRTRPQGVETEVFAFGRLPLAWSARCYTARAANLPKDACEFRCLAYPDGILMQTQEDEPFLAFNGVQTQSARTFNLLGAVEELVSLGVEHLRISPQSHHTREIVERFRLALDGNAVDSAAVEDWLPVGSCDGYWRGDAGMARVAENPGA